jgi:hypothetical protein
MPPWELPDWEWWWRLRWWKVASRASKEDARACPECQHWIDVIRFMGAFDELVVLNVRQTAHS